MNYCTILRLLAGIYVFAIVLYDVYVYIRTPAHPKFDGEIWFVMVSIAAVISGILTMVGELTMMCAVVKKQKAFCFNMSLAVGFSMTASLSLFQLMLGEFKRYNCWSTTAYWYLSLGIFNGVLTVITAVAAVVMWRLDRQYKAGHVQGDGNGV